MKRTFHVKMSIMTLILSLVVAPAWAQIKTGEVIPHLVQDQLGVGQRSSEQTVEILDASFVRFHFTIVGFSPGDKLEIRDGANQLVQSFQDSDSSDIWSILIYDQPVRLVLSSASANTTPRYEVDKIVKGDPGFGRDAQCQHACGLNIECVNPSQQYNNRRPVARWHFIRDAIEYLCTSWMVGDPDCLITNNHCVENSPVNTWIAEFNYECTTCPDGVVKATTQYTAAGILASAANLDYALIDMVGNPGAVWGILAVNTARPTLNSLMYMIDHSDSTPKGIVSGVYTAFVKPPNTCIGVLEDVRYSAMELGGASGAPVFCRLTNLVEALNHCRDDGGNPNCSPGWGVPMARIAPQIGSVMFAHGCTYDFRYQPLPSLTNWGLLVLLGLLILSGVYVIYQRRKGVARA
jgi:hypothetical protein